MSKNKSICKEILKSKHFLSFEPGEHVDFKQEAPTWRTREGELGELHL